MRKVLLITLFILLAAQEWVHGQLLTTEQYTVLVERTVTHWQPSSSYMKYVHSPTDIPQNYEMCFRDWGEAPATPEVGARGDGYCYVYDNNDGTGCSHQGALDLRYYAPNSTTPVFVGNAIQDLKSIPIDGTRTYYDTIHVIGAMNIASIESRLYEESVYTQWDYYDNPNWTPECTFLPVGSTLVPGPALTTVTSGVQSRDGTYHLSTSIRIVPSQDVTYTLPTHDKILLNVQKLTALTPLGFYIYYQTIYDGALSWHLIPNSCYTTADGLTAAVSAYDLFGANYENFLNTTVRLKYGGLNGTFLTPLSFTVRLSSPHITGITPTHLNCYERNEGAVKIQFDRALLSNEKLSILVNDIKDQTYYSALNLSSLAPDNTYTWPNELRAGEYFFRLLGKYAKGPVYDLTVNNRYDTIPEYLAMNSISFEDGFNTSETSDFNAYTDYSGYSMATYTGSINHVGFQTITQPKRIYFSAAVQKNVLCKGSATGSVAITALGGILHYKSEWPFSTSNYKYSLKREGDADYSPWVEFANKEMAYITYNGAYTLSTTQLVNNLKAGKYTLRVRDEVDCYAKDIDGNEVTYSFTITEPEKGITLDLYEVSPITRHDLANAQVKVQISGGTPFVTTPEVARNPYLVTFTNKATNEELPVTNTILEANKRMQSVTGLLPEGDYILRIYDAYYATNSANPGGCKFEMEIPIRKPQPLLVTIKEKNPISCYDSTDGKLLADATGGIKLDSPKYNFKWYKVTNEGNSLLTDTDSTLDNAAAGSYMVEVTDKYNNVKASETFVFAQPSPLLLNPTSTPTNCYSDSNGVLQVTVTGGTPFGNGSYKYEWSTGARTPIVNKVLGGDYVIVVTDSNFCMARGTVSVTSPVRILSNAVVAQVTCRDKCDGQISLNATGGQGVYTYNWSTGATAASISNLCPGKYWYKVTDIGGCSESDTVEISNPDTLAVNIGKDRKICIGQTIKLDATASNSLPLTYNWESSNGFTANTAKVAVTQAGTYRVAVSNSRNCVVRDTVEITSQNSIINTEFIVSTQAFVNESVTLVNLSQPRTDSVKWLIPSQGNVVRPVLETNDKCELTFSDTGRYAITMQAYYPSGCYDDTTKTVIVLNRSGSVTSGSQSDAYLKSAVIRPNPNPGTFKVELSFSETTRARLRLINSLTNSVVDDRLIQGQKDYNLVYNISSHSVGMYMLVIDAAKGSFVYKVMVLR